MDIETLDDEPIEGFSDAEIAEQLEPFFADIDADYAAALDPIVEEFKKKGPPTNEITESFSAVGSDTDSETSSAQLHANESGDDEATVGDDPRQHAEQLAEILYGALGDKALKALRSNDLAESWNEVIGLFEAWNADAHPRGSNGRWVKKGSGEAAQTAKEAVGKALRGETSGPEAAKEILQHLNLLTVKQLNDLHKQHGKPIPGKLREQLVAGILDRVGGGEHRKAAEDLAAGPSAEKLHKAAMAFGDRDPNDFYKAVADAYNQAANSDEKRRAIGDFWRSYKAKRDGEPEPKERAGPQGKAAIAALEEHLAALGKKDLGELHSDPGEGVKAQADTPAKAIEPEDVDMGFGLGGETPKAPPTAPMPAKSTSKQLKAAQSEAIAALRHAETVGGDAALQRIIAGLPDQVKQAILREPLDLEGKTLRMLGKSSASDRSIALDEIRKALPSLGPESTRIHIAALRKALPNLTHDEITEGLKDLSKNNELTMYPLDDPRQITPEVEAAAVHSSTGVPHHIFYRGGMTSSGESNSPKNLQPDPKRPDQLEVAPKVGEAKTPPTEQPTQPANPLVTHTVYPDRTKNPIADQTDDELNANLKSIQRSLYTRRQDAQGSEQNLSHLGLGTRSAPGGRKLKDHELQAMSKRGDEIKAELAARKAKGAEAPAEPTPAERASPQQVEANADSTASSPTDVKTLDHLLSWPDQANHATIRAAIDHAHSTMPREAFAKWAAALQGRKPGEKLPGTKEAIRRGLRAFVDRVSDSWQQTGGAQGDKAAWEAKRPGGNSQENPSGTIDTSVKNDDTNSGGGTKPEPEKTMEAATKPVKTRVKIDSMTKWHDLEKAIDKVGDIELTEEEIAEKAANKNVIAAAARNNTTPRELAILRLTLDKAHEKLKALGVDPAHYYGNINLA